MSQLFYQARYKIENAEHYFDFLASSDKDAMETAKVLVPANHPELAESGVEVEILDVYRNDVSGFV